MSTRKTHPEWLSAAPDAEETARKRRLMTIADALREDARNGKAVSELVADLEVSLEVLMRDGAARSTVHRLGVADLVRRYPHVNRPVVDGLFRRGETCNVIADPKVGKSWMVYGLALSVVGGRPWLDRFDTTPGRVLLIDNELHPQTLASRIPLVCQAMEMFPADLGDRLEVWPLRGNLKTIHGLGQLLRKHAARKVRMIIFDSRYRFRVAGESENDNAAEAMFYNEVDRIAHDTEAAIVMVHHTSKGDQSGKKITDIGAGAGSQARAADCHVVLRQHELPDHFVLEAAVRSFPPVEPMVLRWKFPQWVPVVDADPGKLKGKADPRQEQRDYETADAITTALSDGALTASKIRKATGFGESRVTRGLAALKRKQVVKATETVINGNKCAEYCLA